MKYMLDQHISPIHPTSLHRMNARTSLPLCPEHPEGCSVLSVSLGVGSKVAMCRISTFCVLMGLWCVRWMFLLLVFMRGRVKLPSEGWLHAPLLDSRLKVQWHNSGALWPDDTWMGNPTCASHYTIYIQLSLLSILPSSKIPPRPSLLSSACQHVVGIWFSGSNVETE